MADFDEAFNSNFLDARLAAYINYKKNYKKSCDSNIYNMSPEKMYQISEKDMKIIKRYLNKKDFINSLAGDNKRDNIRDEELNDNNIFDKHVKTFASTELINSDPRLARQNKIQKERAEKINQAFCRDISARNNTNIRKTPRADPGIATYDYQPELSDISDNNNLNLADIPDRTGKNYGYRNPVEHYFYYVDPSLQVNFDNPIENMRGGSATRLDNHEINKNKY